MKTNRHFGQVLDDVDQLSVEEQETLIEVVRHRIIERRRKEILQEIKEAKSEFKQGKAIPVTPDELKGKR